MRIKIAILTILLAPMFFFLSPVYGQQSNDVLTKVGNPTTTPPPIGDNTSGSFVYYFQGDPKWGYTGPLSTCNVCHCGWAMCGPTSLAMIVSTLGTVMTPLEVDTVFNQHSWRPCGDYGTNIYGALSSSWFKNLGFGYISMGWGKPDLNRAADLIHNKGYYLIASADDHLFVIDDVDPANNKVHLRDPAKNIPAGYWSSADSPWTSRKTGLSYSFKYSYAVGKIQP